MGEQLPVVWNRRAEARRSATQRVLPVTWTDLDERFHGCILRGFHQGADGDCDRYREEIAELVDRHDLGDVLWPMRDFCFAGNFRDVVDHIAERGLWVFDVWNYMPETDYDLEGYRLAPVAEAHEYLVERLGVKFLGWDNGEQDGRYHGSYALRNCPQARTRREAWERFARFMQRVAGDQVPYLTVLLGLYHAHHLAHLGWHRLLGAETGQMLPSVPPWYAHIRGAGKQYGLLWFGNASVFNRWGYTSYELDDGYAGPDKGTSLSLLKRLWYVEFMYGACLMSVEHAQVHAGELTPVGRLQQEAVRWCAAHDDLGVQYTPVAFLVDFYAGWQAPRNAYALSWPYRTWGELDYTAGDHQVDQVFRLVWPGYEDASYYRDERGFLTATPVGDIFDVLTTNAGEDVLARYRCLMVLGDVLVEGRLWRKLERFVRAGGDVIVAANQLGPEAAGLAALGPGRVTVLPAPFGLTGPDPDCRLDVDAPLPVRAAPDCQGPVWGEDQPLPSPYALAPDVAETLLDRFAAYQLVRVPDSGRIQTIVNVGGRADELVLTLVNNGKSPWRGTPTLAHGEIAAAEDLFAGSPVATPLEIAAGDVGIYRLRAAAPAMRFAEPRAVVERPVRLAAWTCVAPDRDLGANIELLRRTDVRGVEIWGPQVIDLTDDELHLVAQQLAAAELEAVALNLVPCQMPVLGAPFGYNVPAWRQRAAALAERAAHVAAALAVPRVIVTGAGCHGGPDTAARLATDIADFARQLRYAGRDVVVELSHGCHVERTSPWMLPSPVSALAELLDAIGEGNVHAAVNLGHVRCLGQEPVTVATALGDRLVYVQFNACRRSFGGAWLDVHAPWSDDPAGEALLAHLQATGFAGIVCLDSSWEQKPLAGLRATVDRTRRHHVGGDWSR